jgi:hypothetical protein
LTESVPGQFSVWCNGDVDVDITTTTQVTT